MNNPFDYIPDAACNEAFGKLVEHIEALKTSLRPDDVEFCRELQAGKMLGVMIARDKSGEPHTLYAFSGQIGDKGFYYPGFVGPVFDYLQPDGYFKAHEAKIVNLNKEIDDYEREILSALTKNYEDAKWQHDAVIAEYKEKCRLSKLARDRQRASGFVDEAELITQSQFEKAELRRLKKKLANKLAPLYNNVEQARKQLNSLKEKRRKDSESLQQWLFTNFTLLNARGESKSICEIFADTSAKIPPSGAGECCAPKLLHAAFTQGLHPLSIAEYWYGKPKDGEVRLHGKHYPACRGKCLPILTWMLQGLSVTPSLEGERNQRANFEPAILFENQWFCVVDKPSGMLSVPGKCHAVSLQQWLEEHYGAKRFVKLVHRLDQDTSGLIIAAFSSLVFKILQSMFARRQVKKTYVALLEGDYTSLNLPQRGQIDLPLSPDWLDRPRQRVDIEKGKQAITDYEFLSIADGRSLIKFHPHTGRTHQLRVHAASDQGLAMPIVGDRLYGTNPVTPSGRLMLHAQTLQFTFPIDNQTYTFNSP